MKVKAFLRYFGFCLFFGLCITLLSGRAAAFAGENDAKLNVTDVSITKDGSYKLKVYNLTESQTVMYRSGDTEIALVSKTGMVTGRSYGSTVVSATIVEDGNAVATLQCNVIIGPAAVSIKLTKTSLVLMAGMQKRLYANVLPLNTVEKPMFGSTDTEIAKVSSVGRVRAVQPGSVQIYAMLDNGECSVCDVTVLNDEDYAKYLDGKSIDEILTESAEEPDDVIIDEFTDEDNGEESGSGNEEKAEEPVAEEITDKTEKTTDRDGSADKTVQDTPNAVEEK